MSKRICKNCGSIDIRTTKYSDGGKCYVCNDCCSIGVSDVFPEYTVFNRLTSSPEVLAEKLVYHIYLTDCLQRKRSYWRSTFFPCNKFLTKEKAIAATVEELNKEWKNE